MAGGVGAAGTASCTGSVSMMVTGDGSGRLGRGCSRAEPRCAPSLRQPAQREHGPRLSTHSAPIFALPKLKPPADLFQITLHFDRGKSALGHDALQTHRSFQDQYRDDGSMPGHRVSPANGNNTMATRPPTRSWRARGGALPYRPWPSHAPTPQRIVQKPHVRFQRCLT